MRRRNPSFPPRVSATSGRPSRRGGATNIPRPLRSRRRRGGLPFEGESGRSRATRGWGSDGWTTDRKSTRLNSSHVRISYAVFCLKKKIGDSIGEHELFFCVI